MFAEFLLDLRKTDIHILCLYYACSHQQTDCHFETMHFFVVQNCNTGSKGNVQKVILFCIDRWQIFYFSAHKITKKFLKFLHLCCVMLSVHRARDGWWYWSSCEGSSQWEAGVAASVAGRGRRSSDGDRRRIMGGICRQDGMQGWTAGSGSRGADCCQAADVGSTDAAGTRAAGTDWGTKTHILCNIVASLLVDVGRNVAEAAKYSTCNFFGEWQ